MTAITITMSDTALKAGETSLVTVSNWTSSESPSAYATASGGTLGSWTGSGDSYTATFTPTSNVTSPINSVALNMTPVDGSDPIHSDNYAIDTARPSSQIAVGDSTLTVGETATVTITFSEAVIGFSLDDLVVSNGTLSNLDSGDGGRNWTATFTPSAAVNANSNLITLDNTRVTDSAGNTGSDTTSSNNYAVQTSTPTATIALSDYTISSRGRTNVTITFSEAVAGLTADDITVSNGTITTPTSSNGGVTWRAVFTPTTMIEDASNNIVLNLEGITVVSSGNAGVGTVTSSNYAIDTIRPTIAVTFSDTELTIGETATVTFAFSEEVKGFEVSDFRYLETTSADHRVIGAFSGFSTTDNITWTAIYTPPASIEERKPGNLSLVVIGLADLFGNEIGGGSVSFNGFKIDTVRPTSTIAVGDSTLTAGESTTVTVTFSEAVPGFTADDLPAINGSLGTFVSSNNGITWTASYTPDADLASATNVITLDNTGIADAAGNAGSGAASSANFTIDTVRPTATITVADTALEIGAAALVTIVFSQAVSGFSNDDLTVANGTLGEVTSQDGITWTATFTPSAGIEDAAAVVTLDMSGVAASGSGNAGTGTATSNSVDVDTTSPVATISIGAASLGPNDNTQVTIVFSEPVANLTLGALAADNATLSGLSSSDGGVTWTATLTPDANVRASGNVVRLNGFTDAAGNPGAAVASGAFSIDSVPPQPDPVAPPETGDTADTVDTIDGVDTTIATSVNPVTGLESTTITIPVVADDRRDDSASPNADMADIPLRLGQGGLTDLVVSLPSGSGMVVERPGAPLQLGQAMVDISARIDAIAAPSSREYMVKLSSSFLQGLDQKALVHTATLTPTERGNAGNGATLHIGAGSGLGQGQLGLVVDVSGLAHAPVIELNDVQFAAIIGAASLRGGAGSNVVVGDDAAQTIFLGADDDMLYGGGGDDIIGSAGGNDLLDGGAGNDVVTGGIGNDRLLGGSGDDVLNGGRSDRGAWQFVLGTDGVLAARHETAVYNPGNWETVALSELDPSASGLSFLHVPVERIETLALLYHAIVQRAPDLAGLAFWAQYDGSAAEIAQMMSASGEFMSGTLAALDNEAFVRSLYLHTLGRAADAGGLAFWTAQLVAASPHSRADVLLAFALSDEHQAHARTDGALEIAGGTLLQESQWFAGSGDDLLDGGLGSDRIDGGDGIDTVAYGGVLAQYRFLLGADGSIGIADGISGDIDLVRGIERGAFADGVVDLSFTQANPAVLQTVGLLYQSLFDRAGGLAGISWWSSQSGDTAQLAEAMAASAEFQQRFGAASDLEFVQALFSNTGLESGAAGGLASWLDYATTHGRAQLVTAWIAHAEVIGVQFAGDGLWL